MCVRVHACVCGVWCVVSPALHGQLPFQVEYLRQALEES